MKYKSKHHYSPVDELNQENTARLLNPFKVIGYSLVLGPVAIALILSQKMALDAFAMRHPVLVGLSLIIISVIGMVLLVKKMLW